MKTEAMLLCSLLTAAFGAAQEGAPAGAAPATPAAAGDRTPDAPCRELLLPAHGGRDAYTPAAAFGANGYLVVWQSGRNGPGDLRKGINLIGDIVGCRVDGAGSARDAEPFVICGAADQQENPSVAFGDGTFLVVWQDIRNGRDWDVYAARVTADGPPAVSRLREDATAGTAGQARVLDAGGFLVAGGAHNQAKPRVVWDGHSFVVAWQDMRNGRWYEIRAARVSATGEMLDKEAVLVASGNFYHCFDPALASAGDGRSFLVHIAEGDPVDGYKVPGVQGWFLQDGRPVAKPAYVMDKGNKPRGDQGPDGRCGPMSMAAGGGACLLAWKNDSSLGRGSGTAGNAALFDAGGVRKRDFSFSAGKGARDPKRILNPSVAWDGSAFVLAWHEFVRERTDGCPSDAVFARRVMPDGSSPAEPRRIAGTFANPASSPSVASDGAGRALVAYEKHPATGDVPIRIGVCIMGAR